MRDKKIEIRVASSKDKKSVRDLWEYSFSDTDRFVDYYFAERFSPDNTVCLFSDDHLEAALQLNPYNLVISDVVTEVKYVVGVSVQPESRGQGYMSALIKETLNMQYQNGEEFSILMPIDTRIYEKYGYANCFFRHEFLMDLDRIDVKDTRYQVRRIDLQSVENAERDIHNLSQIYYDAVSRHHSFISRNSRYWKNRMAELAVEDGQFFIAYDGKTPKGYAMIIAKTSDGIGNVVEMAFGDKDAYYALMKLIRSHVTQFKRVRINTPQLEEFLLMSGFDNKIEHRVQPFMMGRVIDAEKVLDVILYKTHIFGDKRQEKFNDPEELAVEIKDPYIEENNIIAVCKDGKIVRMLREGKDDMSQVGESAMANRLTMDIGALTQLYTKAITLRRLYQMGKVKMTGEKLYLFEKLFGTETGSSYVNDYI
ncbi:MAG: GNAT family N-acetyltransferase [Peptostreptococcaceae bacterium]|nr:GNAT family N-acetyltransferase [Peptostreptococcaceae bacterium]